MDEFSERKLKLMKRERELEKLFEEASNRRKQLLRNAHDRKSNYSNINMKKENFILKPLSSSQNVTHNYSYRNKVWKEPSFIRGYLHRDSAYYSHQNLPETDLDEENISLCKTNIGSNVVGSHGNIAHSSNVIIKSPLHHSTFVALSSSTDDLDTSHYCHFTPTTSSSASNTTYSSQYSRTDNSTGKSSNFDANSSTDSRSIKNTEGSISRKSAAISNQTTVSPLLGQKYRGSPVVIIDNELRAAANESKSNRPCAILEKPPMIPHYKRHKSQKHVASSEMHLFLSGVLDERNHEECTASEIGNSSPKSVTKATKKRLLEEYMKKRLSIGDYSTRGLIEWEKNLSSRDLLQDPDSGDLHITNDRRKLSCQSDFAFQLLSTHHTISFPHNFSSEINIPRMLSTENIKEPSVSFCSKNRKADDRNQSFRFSKHTSFIRRSMNDIVAALRNMRSSERECHPKRSLFSSRPNNAKHGIFKKRSATSSDLLYSVPPFVRKHMPPDISGGSRIASQEAYKSDLTLPSSTPNLIAELDPTFRESSIEKEENEVRLPHRQLSKRSRSYRLSFIEDAHSVATKKLTSSNVATSTSGDNILRFVQPRRRVGSGNNTNVQRHPSPKPSKHRHGNSHRLSCAQQ